MRNLWQCFEEAISPEVIEKINALGQSKPEEEGRIFNGSTNEIRRSTIRWIKEEEIRDLLWGFVHTANVTAFGVDVQNYAEIQYTEYFATNEGHYSWHHDINWTADIASDRKLSVTVQLTDGNEYEGGDFEFNEVASPTSCKKLGTVLVFPSYLNHRVLPVTKGTRRSLVAWFYGPRWR